MEDTAGTRVLLGDHRKGLLTLAIPIGVAFFVQQINNIVDSLWVTGLGGDAMAAVGLVYPIYCVITGIGSGLGIGSSAAIARNIGIKDRDSAEKCAGQSIVLTLFVSIAITAALVPTASMMLPIMGAGTMLQSCLDYAYPMYYMAFFILLSSVMSGMLRGEGQAKRSMTIQIIGAVLNMILDPLFIFVLDMGVAGAAWATVVSFTVSSVVAIYWYHTSKEMYIRLRKQYLRPDVIHMGQILSVGLPEAAELSIMNIFDVILNYFVIMVGGTDAVAIYTTSWKVVMLLMIPAQALGGAMVTICSAMYVTGRFTDIRDSFRFSLVKSVKILIIFSVILLIVADPLATVFTHSEDMMYLHDEMAYLLRMYALFIPVFSIVYVGSSLMQSLEEADNAMINSTIRNLFIALLFGLAAIYMGTLHWVWYAMVVGELIGGVMMGIHAIYTINAVEKRVRAEGKAVV